MQILEDEEWRDIPGHQHYMVSNLGRVKSMDRWVKYEGVRPYFKRGRVLKTWISLGYPCCNLRRGSSPQAVHRLVAQAFLGPAPEGCEVNHRDGDKSNPRLTNLEYVTHHQNMMHAKETGLWDNRGSKHPDALADEAAMSLAHELVRNGLSYKEAGESVGTSDAAVRAMVRGRTWKHLKLKPFHIERFKYLNKREQIHRLRSQGYSHKDIANIVGVSTMTAWRYCHADS